MSAIDLVRSTLASRTELHAIARASSVHQKVVEDQEQHVRALEQQQCDQLADMLTTIGQKSERVLQKFRCRKPLGKFIPSLLKKMCKNPPFARVGNETDICNM